MNDKRVEAAVKVIWDSVVWDAYTDRQQNARGRIVAEQPTGNPYQPRRG